MSDPLAELIAANRRFAATFGAGTLPRPPVRPVAVLTCLDGRVVPERFLQLGLGEVNVLRNAGGRVTEDVIRSLVVSSWLLGTRMFLVIHHTDCGLLADDDAAVRAAIAAKGGDGAGIELRTFADLEASVREDAAALRTSALLPPDAGVAGFVYEVRTGLLTPVDPPSTTSSP